MKVIKNIKKINESILDSIPDRNHLGYVIHNVTAWERDYSPKDLTNLDEVARACAKYDDDYTVEEYKTAIEYYNFTDEDGNVIDHDGDEDFDESLNEDEFYGLRVTQTSNAPYTYYFNFKEPLTDDLLKEIKNRIGKDMYVLDIPKEYNAVQSDKENVSKPTKVLMIRLDRDELDEGFEDSCSNLNEGHKLYNKIILYKSSTNHIYADKEFAKQLGDSFNLQMISLRIPPDQDNLNLKATTALDEDITQSNDTKTCVICGKEFTGHGNNAQPVKDGLCCDNCNMTKVIPTRLNVSKKVEDFEHPLDKVIKDDKIAKLNSRIDELGAKLDIMLEKEDYDRDEFDRLASIQAELIRERMSLQR